MPTISAFYGLIIRMYYRDHEPAHFHVFYQGNEAKIDIERLQLMAGHLPRRALSLALDWAELHQNELRQLETCTATPADTQHRAAGVNPMMPRVIKVVPLRPHRVYVEFDDGVSGTIDLSDELDGEVFRSLRDETVFRQVAVDEFGAVCWPNGPDLAPDAMHSQLIGEPAIPPRR
jgi:hypothetical protein